VRSQVTNAAAREEWRHYWKLVLAATMGSGVASVLLYSSGLLIQPVASEMGWSITQVSSGMLIMSVIGMMLSPLAGVAIDRYGSRAIAMPGTIMFCVALASLGLANRDIWVWWLLWTFVGAAGLLIKPTVWSRAISSRFDAARGLALAVCLSGSGLFAAVVPFITISLIDAFGWRGAYGGLGLITGSLTIPIMWLFFFDGREMTRDNSTITTHNVPIIPGVTFARGIRSRQLYLLAAVAFLSGCSIIGLTVHFVPFAVELGFSRDEAAVWLMLIAILSLVGRLGTGMLLDRVNPALVTCVGIALPVVAAGFLLLLASHTYAILIAVMLIGLATGSEHASIAYLATRYFGLRAFGALFGIITSCLIAAVGVGPFVASYVRDRNGSYDDFLMAAMAAGVFCILLLLGLGPLPELDEPSEASRRNGQRL